MISKISMISIDWSGTAASHKTMSWPMPWIRASSPGAPQRFRTRSRSTSRPGVGLKGSLKGSIRDLLGRA